MREAEGSSFSTIRVPPTHLVSPPPRRRRRGLGVLAACLPALLVASVAWPHLEDASRGLTDAVRAGGREPPLIKAPIGPIKVPPPVELALQEGNLVEQMIDGDQAWRAESEVLPGPEQPILPAAVEPAEPPSPEDPPAPDAEAAPVPVQSAAAAESGSTQEPDEEPRGPEAETRLRLEPPPPLVMEANAERAEVQASSPPVLQVQASPRADAAEPVYRVQIAAMPTEATALEVWNTQRSLNADLFVGHSPVIEQAESGAQTFFRVQVGDHQTLSDAQAFCDELGRREVACVVVRR